MDTLPLSLPVTRCKGVGEKTARMLERIGITTVGDLLYHLPRTYLDRRALTRLLCVRASQHAVVRGRVAGVRSFRHSRRLHITQCTVKDETGSLKAVWFNQPYIRMSLPVGQEVILSGNVSDRDGLQMQNPDVEVLHGEAHNSIHTLGLVPVYPLTEGLGQRRLRRLIDALLNEFLDDIPENLPEWIAEKQQLISRKEALRNIHFPAEHSDHAEARKRIVFEEFLRLQLHIQSESAGERDEGIAHAACPRLVEVLRRRIPFKLTRAQERAIDELFRQMKSPNKMNALLQGDVGSGKTVVAAHAMLKSVENNRQAVLMAPTEILAEQHFHNLRGLVHEIGVKTLLLSGSVPAQEKRDALKLLASGEPSLIVGTHALIQQRVVLPNLGLAIIDEQHRFGVNQRAALRDKALNPDLIVMTATPIPRTLALTLYGGFASIVIDEHPAGRHPVETRHVRETDRETMYGFIESQTKLGKQIFVVCPEIGPGRRDREIASVGKVCSEYARAFPRLTVRVLHGRMHPEDRETTLLRFRSKEFEILVATTIIEVGVDVPNASVMIIESADRFGLTQLHQLRGRVGRSGHKSYCFLVAEPTTPEAVERIDIMTSTNDGFEIAERDMLLRGPGEFLGTAQSGLPQLRAGHLVRDAELLKRAGETAADILAADPGLTWDPNAPLGNLLGKRRPRAVHL